MRCPLPAQEEACASHAIVRDAHRRHSLATAPKCGVEQFRGISPPPRGGQRTGRHILRHGAWRISPWGHPLPCVSCRLASRDAAVASGRGLSRVPRLRQQRGG